MSNRTCSVPECDRAHFGRDLCNMHYLRWRKSGTTDPAPKTVSYCKVEECGRQLTPPYGRGMCGLHYNRWKRHGDPHYVRQSVTGVAACSISACGKPVLARGWCAAHWTRWKRHGDPSARLQGEVMDGKRVCPTCRIDKALGDFFANGRGGPCRDCASEYSREWKRNNPDKVRENMHRRRARIHDAFIENVEMSALLQRDGNTCQLCMLPVKLDAAFPDPHFPTVDHVIPLIRGGEHSYANTQVAHYLCNVQKGARMTE